LQPPTATTASTNPVTAKTVAVFSVRNMLIANEPCSIIVSLSRLRPAAELFPP
jgi:hypothetical protein